MTPNLNLQKANGKTGEWIRWIGGIVLAAGVAYYTTISTMDKQIATTQERENNHFEEVLRRLEVLQMDVRELRTGDRSDRAGKNFFQNPQQP